MKTLQKYIYWLLFTILFLIIAFYGLHTAKAPHITTLRFCVSNGTESEKISVYDAEDGNCYVFLPSYAELDQVTVAMQSGQQISLGGIKLSNGMACSEFALNTAYPLEISSQYNANLWFYQSANVATMYIDTATGSMEHIHKDKNYEEYASVTLYTADGEMDYSGEVNTLKGRGNATWGYDKRPYSLKLSSEADLLDMGAAMDWVLLANATDETNLNNYVVFNLASRSGFSWTPECRYADLYLNGEYSGLYLLSEKVEIGASRLNIDSSAGNFLCKFDLNSRWDTLRNPFATASGRTVELTCPENLPQAEHAEVLSLVNQMEQAILSGTDLNAEKIVDLDSWVRRYLIDEISGNIDSDLASSYFYFSDGVCYAGPIWDYDMALGNNSRSREPNSFIAKNAWKSETYASPYYSALYENHSFYSRMTETYRSEFLPLLQQMIAEDIPSFARFIGDASQMNSLRWRFMYDMVQGDAARNTEDLIEYLNDRVSFLTDVWLEGTDYCTLQFEFSPNEAYWNISLPKGSIFALPYVDVESTVWIDASTQDAYDFRQPLTKDVTLTLRSDPVAEDSPTEYVPVTRDYIVFLSIAILLILFGWIAAIDALHRRKERGCADERRRTKVSP